MLNMFEFFDIGHLEHLAFHEATMHYMDWIQTESCRMKIFGKLLLYSFAEYLHEGVFFILQSHETHSLQ